MRFCKLHLISREAPPPSQRHCWLIVYVTAEMLRIKLESSHLNPPHVGPSPQPPLELLEEDVAEKGQYAGRQQPDGTLVDGDDVFQGVDALLHGVGVDVVINGGPDAPNRPHSIHQRFDGGRDHGEDGLLLDAAGRGSCRRFLLGPPHCRETRG